VALLLGNEHQGIAEELRAACTRAVRVPMVGFVESLNVSVTAGILLFSATRGRTGDLSPSRRKALYARALWLTVPRPAEHLETHRKRRI
jgi:tRNA (guanosine-2'-O-)-methyltransferase